MSSAVQKHPKMMVALAVTGSMRERPTARQARRYRKNMRRYTKKHGHVAAWGGPGEPAW